MTGLVTGEAVLLELRPAKLGSRAVAVIIDLALQWVVLVVGALLLGALSASLDSAATAAILLTYVVLVVVGVPVASETLSRGRTLGKLAMGLRTLREDGGPIRFRHALVRGLLGVVEFWVTGGVLAVIVSFASSSGRRLGDFLAGTIVVHERVPRSAAPMVAMPPHLAHWAGNLDLARLPDDLALAVRQYVVRSGELAPAARDAMATRLATAVAASVSPPPPPGTPAHVYLCAVLAERRRRDVDRAAGSAPQPTSPPPAPPPPQATYPSADDAAPPPTPAAGPTPDDDRPGGGFAAPG